MITQKVIDEIYRTYRRRASSPENLKMQYLNEELMNLHKIEIADDKLIIGSMDANSPFRRLSLRFIHGIENFENDVAIVLHSSIIFLSKHKAESRVHLKLDKPSFWHRLMQKLKILR